MVKGAMMLVFHTAGVPYKPSGKGSCLDPYFTKVGAGRGGWRARAGHRHDVLRACLRA